MKTSERSATPAAPKRSDPRVRGLFKRLQRLKGERLRLQSQADGLESEIRDLVAQAVESPDSPAVAWISDLLDSAQVVCDGESLTVKVAALGQVTRAWDDVERGLEEPGRQDPSHSLFHRLSRHMVLDLVRDSPLLAPILPSQVAFVLRSPGCVRLEDRIDDAYWRVKVAEALDGLASKGSGPARRRETLRQMSEAIAESVQRD